MIFKSFHIVLIQIVIIIIVLFPVEHLSTIKWITSYLFLFVILKSSNKVSPITWLMGIWNIIFINAYSGIIIYHSSFNHSALFYLLCTLSIFALGYFLPNKTNTTAILASNFKSNLTKNESRLITILSYFSIIGGIFIFIDIVVLSGGSISNFSALRLLMSDRDVSIYGQLAAIFLAGSFPALITLILFEYKKQTFLLISVMALAIGSIVTAGRQNIFQIFLICILAVLIKYRYNLKFKINWATRFLSFIVVGLVITYLIILSLTRDISSMDKNKMIGYANTNNLTYSEDFKKLSNAIPIEASNFIADFTFYFSEEIIVYSDAFKHNRYPIVNIDFLQFFPFFERQLHKLGLRENTLEYRMKNLWKKNYQSSVFNSAWGTSVLFLLKCFGYIGGLIVVFLHGLFSQYIFRSFTICPCFSTTLALVANNLILFYTAITPITQEISFMFFMFLSFFILFRKKIRT